MTAPRSSYRPDIDGIRALAVVAVVAYHAFPAVVPSGFVGVDIFFVISGFLISGIILKEHASARFSFVQFYVRRIKRLFPALTVVLTATLVAGWFLLFPDEFKQLGKHLVAGAGFGSNILLWRETGYFDTTAEMKPLLHLWSLGIEEQFYLVWPLLLGLVLWQGRRPLPLLIVMFAASFAVNLKLLGTSAAFFLPVTRFWELLAGAMLACVAEQRRGVLLESRHARYAAWLGLALLLLSFIAIDRTRAFPGWWSVPPVAGTLLLIASGDDAWPNRRLFSIPVVVGIGLISYPLYLWHWPLLAFARIIASGVPSVMTNLVLVAVSFALALLTYRFVEKPIRFGSRSGRVPLALCAAMIVIAGAGFVVKQQRGMPSRFRADAATLADLTYDHTALGYQPCPAAIGSTKPALEYCFQSKSAPATLVMLGDSHADHIFAGVAAVDTTHSWLLLGHPSCPPLEGVQVKVDQDGCRERSEAALRFVEADPTVQTVVLSFFGSYILDTNYAAEHLINHMGGADATITAPGKAGSKPELFYEGLERTVTRLERAGKRVVVLFDVAELPFVPRACVRRASFMASAQPDCAVAKSDVLARQQEPRALLAKLLAAHPQLASFDPLDAICDGQRCAIKIEDTLLYRDSHHLSFRGSQRVARAFLAWLDKGT